MSGEPWVRVTREHRCPICGRDSWCGVSADRAYVVCMRSGSGATKQTANGGWLHKIGERTAPLPAARSIASAKVPIDWTAEYEKALAHTGEADLAELAEDLGVNVESLRRLRAARSRRWANAWCFPMLDSRGRIVGVRVRERGRGGKWAARRSSEGAFVPLGLSSTGTVLVVEGPTTTAAALSLGFEAIGRPSAKPGTAALATLLALLRDRDVVLVGENDQKPTGEWPGKAGVEFCANLLRRVTARLRIVYPPPEFKDVRDMLKAGATHADLAALIEAAPDVAGSLGTLEVRR